MLLLLCLYFVVFIFLQSTCVCLVAQSCLTLCDPMDCSPPGSSVLGDSSGKNTGLGCCALLQGIFSTQGLNPLQVDSLPIEPPGKPVVHVLFNNQKGYYNKII